MSEILIAYNCAICKHICFFVKSYNYKKILLVNQFSFDLHSCQFCWHDYINLRPLDKINKLPEDFTAEQLLHWEKEDRLVINPNRLLVYQTDVKSAKLILDNGEIKNFKISSTIELPLNRVIEIDADSLLKKSIHDFKIIDLIAGDTEFADIKTIELEIADADLTKLEQRIVILKRKLAEQNLQPFLIQLKKVKNEIHRRRVVMLDFPFSDKWLEQIELEELIDSSYSRNKININPYISF